MWTHAYGVVACEGLALGLHARGDEPLALTFVREEVAQLDGELSLRLIGVERSQLGAEAFNSSSCASPAACCCA